MNPKAKTTRNKPEHTAAEIVRRLTAWICYLETRSGGKVAQKGTIRRQFAAEARPYILRGATLFRAAGAPCRPLHWTPAL